MKLSTSFSLATVAVLAAAASASSEPAEVYIFRANAEASSSRDSAPPKVPRQIARQILLQRIGADHGSLLEDLPDGTDREQAVSYVRRFGKTPPSLFAETSSAGRPLGEPAQAMVVIEGVTSQHLKALRDALPESQRHAAFAVSDPPSAKANQRLLSIDLAQAGVARSNCEIQAVSNPFGSDCYSDGVFVGGYDLKKVSGLPQPPSTSHSSSSLGAANTSNGGPVRGILQRSRQGP